MAISGAALGPFLDSYHSSFGVLQYDTPFSLTLWGSDDYPALTTTWWVPVLFGLAGVMIGWLYVVLDGYYGSGPSPRTRQPSTPLILIGIALFTLQYWLSGALYQSGMDRTSILNVMSTVAAVGFVALDGTLAGLLVSIATAIGGPLIEVVLLSLSRMGAFSESGYHYCDHGETGFFPLWIVPVYFLGGPSVGNLARGWWQALGNVDSKTSESMCRPGCKVCDDTRRVPCPNCDGIGSYVALGGRSVLCTSCRAKGFVICRSCFSSYEENPEDIEAIRSVISRMPD